MLGRDKKRPFGDKVTILTITFRVTKYVRTDRSEDLDQSMMIRKGNF